MATMEHERVGAWSKQLFGNKHLLGLAASMSGASVVRPLDVQATTGLAASTVHDVLQTLVAVELLERLERGVGQREQLYQRHDHPFWDAAEALSRQAQHSGLRSEPDLTSERMVGHGEDS